MAPQHPLTREVLLKEPDIDRGACPVFRMVMLTLDDLGTIFSGRWSFEANNGDVCMNEGSSESDGSDEDEAVVSRETRIPDFSVFALRRQGVSHRRLVCIVEIKAGQDDPRSLNPQVSVQIVTQARFAFDAFPELLRVFSMVAVGDWWKMYEFPRKDVSELYEEHVAGFKDEDTFKQTRASKQASTIDISQYLVKPFSKVLKEDRSNYSAEFESAIRLMMERLKAR